MTSLCLGSWISYPPAGFPSWVRGSPGPGPGLAAVFAGQQSKPRLVLSPGESPRTRGPASQGQGQGCTAKGAPPRDPGLGEPFASGTSGLARVAHVGELGLVRNRHLRPGTAHRAHARSGSQAPGRAPPPRTAGPRGLRLQGGGRGLWRQRRGCCQDSCFAFRC